MLAGILRSSTGPGSLEVTGADRKWMRYPRPCRITTADVSYIIRHRGLVYSMSPIRLISECTRPHPHQRCLIIPGAPRWRLLEHRWSRGVRSPTYTTQNLPLMFETSWAGCIVCPTNIITTALTANNTCTVIVERRSVCCAFGRPRQYM